MKRKELVSIIITTKNEEDTIVKLLSSIFEQIYKNIEVILVDNHSIDDTLKFAQKFDVTIYNFGPERSAQRNYGAEKSKGKYLLFLDSDMVLTPNVIRECVEKMRQESVGAVVIPEQSIGSSFWEKVKAFERSFYNEKGDQLTDAARFFKRDVFNMVGGYDANITGPEDWDLPETIKEKGFYIQRVSSPIYHYERISSLWLLAKKKYYYALKSNRYFKKHKIPIISPKTIYFLRPVFYKNWKRLILHPVLTAAMFCMLFIELFFGLLGFVVGNFKNEK